MNNQINVPLILDLHHETIVEWKSQGIQLKHQNFLKFVEENHAFNYQLWHAEDKARRDDLGHSFVYAAKREIDQFNQQRNNRMELIDTYLIEKLTPAPVTDCPVHSETPGMMIDRLSILALKIYHMDQQTKRPEVNQAHREACHAKHDTLKAQQKQLAECLSTLISEVAERKRTFCVYYQLKMYNDKTLNPELYAAS
ncbi:MAG: DUF4254 domain-containing protein [Legionellaceae bacterium]